MNKNRRRLFGALLGAPVGIAANATETKRRAATGDDFATELIDCWFYTEVERVGTQGGWRQ